MMFPGDGPQRMGWQLINMMTSPCPDWFLLFFSSHRSFSPRRPVVGLLPGSGPCLCHRPIHRTSVHPGFRKNRRENRLLHYPQCIRRATAVMKERWPRFKRLSRKCCWQEMLLGFYVLSRLRCCGGAPPPPLSGFWWRPEGCGASGPGWTLYYTFMLHVSLFLIFSTFWPSNGPHWRRAVIETRGRSPIRRTPSQSLSRRDAGAAEYEQIFQSSLLLPLTLITFGGGRPPSWWLHGDFSASWQILC